MEWTTIVIVTIGGLIVIFPAVFVWCINIGGICKAIGDWRVTRKAGKVLSNMVCSIDADCPPGYICVDGKCVPAT